MSRCRGGHKVLAGPLLSSFIHAVLHGAVFVLMGCLAPSQQKDTGTQLMELLSHIDFFPDAILSEPHSFFLFLP